MLKFALVVSRWICPWDNVGAVYIRLGLNINNCYATPLAFKITSAMSSYICPGFNVLGWHYAVDTPSTVRWMDVNSLTDSMTDVSSLIRWLIYSYHHLQHTLKYLHSLLLILPISSAISCTYTVALTQWFQCQWNNLEWYGYISHRNPTERINQTKQNTKKSCAYFTGYTVSQGYNSHGTDHCSLGILHQKLTAFLSNYTKDSRKHYLLPGAY